MRQTSIPVESRSRTSAVRHAVRSSPAAETYGGSAAASYSRLGPVPERGRPAVPLPATPSTTPAPRICLGTHGRTAVPSTALALGKRLSSHYRRRPTSSTAPPTPRGLVTPGIIDPHEDEQRERETPEQK